MQKDFHFYCIGVLARAAGYNSNDALTIAYASQYVDNAVESEPVSVGNIFFDPVRTAHNGLKAFDWGVQKKIYFPFHFIPAHPISGEQCEICTRHDSKMANMVLERAINEPDETLRLFRIGVALHTFADTWAHEGFCGKENEVNDVEAIHHKKGSRWKHLLLENLVLDFLPKIGHAQAGHFPDYSHLEWKYKKGADHKEIVRDNHSHFMSCARTIYERLIEVPKSHSEPSVEWSEIERKINYLFGLDTDHLSKKITAWKNEFRDMFAGSDYDYDHRTWRKDALNSEDVMWEDDRNRTDISKRQYKMTPDFLNKPWVQFHRAALLQRHFVLENLIKY